MTKSAKKTGETTKGAAARASKKSPKKSEASAASVKSDGVKGTGKKASKKTKKKTGAGRPRKVTAADRAYAAAIYAELESLYPDAHCALIHENPWQLLVATILSAQCTDERVNMVTPKLFETYPTPAAMSDADLGDIETLIHSTGFFRNKAKNIKGAAVAVTTKYGGDVPRTMDELLSLPGVARKTGNVVLGNAFNINVGVVVDTHISRLSQRLGLTKQTTPEKIERDLVALFPQDNWTMLAHLLIFHGRQVCNARKPRCSDCSMQKTCPQVGVTTSA